MEQQAQQLAAAQRSAWSTGRRSITSTVVSTVFRRFRYIINIEATVCKHLLIVVKYMQIYIDNPVIMDTVAVTSCFILTLSTLQLQTEDSEYMNMGAATNTFFCDQLIC